MTVPFRYLTVSYLLVVTVANAADPDFYRDVYPFLKANCISCHNKTTTKAGLNMETPELMIEGGDSGPSIVPGSSAESLLVEASLHSTDIEMPPKKNKTGAVKLAPKEIATLKLWIDQGAKSSVQQERQVVWRPLAPGVHPIYAAAISANGRFVACGRSNRIYLYDLATRRLVDQIEDREASLDGAHRAMVHALAFSPDGSRLASGSYREVKIWRKEQGPPMDRKGDATLGLRIAALTSDGKQIVGVDSQGALLVLNAATGKVTKKVADVAPSGILLLSISPDATKVAVFAEGWHLSVWNLADGNRLHGQDTPDLTLQTQTRAAHNKHAAAVKAQKAAEAVLPQAQAKESDATKSVADLKAKLAQAPNESLQAQLADAEARLKADTEAETAATENLKTAQKAVAAAKKAADEMQAKLKVARQAGIQALAWTQDSKAIITGGSDKIVRTWTLPASGTSEMAKPNELRGSAGAIIALAAGANPDHLVSAGADNKVRIWSVAQGKTVREIAIAGIVDLEVSADGKHLATAGTDGAIRIWDTETGKQTAELRGSISELREKENLDWTIAAQALEQSFQKTKTTQIEARNKALDELLKKANDAIAAMTKKLPMVEKAVKPLEEARLAAEKVVDEAAAAAETANANGKPDAASVNALKSAQDKLITAETKENDAIAAFEAVKSNITDAEEQVKRITATQAKNAEELAQAEAASEAAKTLQTEASAKLKAAQQALAKTTAKPLAVTFSSDGEQVAVAFDDGSLRVWAVATGEPIAETLGEATTAASLVQRPDRAFVVCGPNASLTATSAKGRWVLDRVLGGEKDLALFSDRVNALCFSPDGRTLATGSGEPSRTGDVTLFEVATGKLSATWKEHHVDSVLSLDFSPDGKLLASGAADKIARVADVATGKPVNLFEGHTHYVTSVRFRADGRVLATAGADGVVNVWDMIQGERKKKIEGWTKEVTSLQFIGATNQIVTSAGDNLIRIVTDDGAQIRSISKLPDFMQVAASTASGNTIVGGGEDSFLRIWNGADGKEITAFGTQ